MIVADARDKILQLVDFKSQSGTKIGREGSGPAEYGKPVTTFRVEFAPPPRAGQGQGPGGGGMMRMGMDMPSASDARGRLYFESAPITMGPDGPKVADSAAVTSYDRSTQKLDTLTWVMLPKNNAQVSGGRGNMNIRIGGANPLTPRDAWSVFPDGEKKEEEAQRNRDRQNSMIMTVEDGPGGMQRRAQMGPGPNAPALAPLTDWPEVKPPFRPGIGAVVARPNGALWVRRTEAAGNKGTLYDVVNAQGAVTHQVRLGEGLNLVGFGNGTVYTTKADADDLLTLQRHGMP